MLLDFTYYLLLWSRQGRPIDALSNCTPEQTLSLFRNEVKLDRCTSRALAVDCDLGRIAAEACDIPLDPAEGFDLV